MGSISRAQPGMERALRRDHKSGDASVNAFLKDTLERFASPGRQASSR